MLHVNTINYAIILSLKNNQSVSIEAGNQRNLNIRPILFIAINYGASISGNVFPKRTMHSMLLI